MPKDYTHEQYWELYKKLPEELKELIFSPKTAGTIFDICKRNSIKGDKISEISRYIGKVLIGVLPPDELQETLEKEVELEKDLAKRVTHEINRFVFSLAKESLAELYKIGVTTIEEIPSAKIEAVSPLEEKQNKQDIYREPTK